jgi:hypothetical protein
MLALVLALTFADPPITDGNWRTHPKVVAIRGEVEALEAQLQGAKPHEKHFPDCLDRDGDMDRYAFKDAQGATRKLHIEGGGSDSAWKMDAYYSDKGALRFVFIKAGAVNGAQLEKRIYFENKKRIFETHQYVTDVGYTFPNPWPDSELPFSATARWARHAACENDD